MREFARAMSKRLTPADSDALVVVDVQNDFLPGGALAVAEGDRVLVPLNELMPKFAHVFATRDWHPRNHRSFRAQGGPWPVHCVQGTLGAAFAPKLQLSNVQSVISKGVDQGSEGYSGFEGTDLEERLRAAGAKRVFVGGLATDYCVKATALDARRRGFEVVVVTDAIAAVNVKPSDEAKALDVMRGAGCTLTDSMSIDAKG